MTADIVNAFRAYDWMRDPDGEDKGPPTTAPPPQSDAESEATVFEVVTPLLPSRKGKEIDRSRSVSEAFDRCLESLELLYRAYLVSENDWRVRVLTRRTIASVIPWTTVDPFEGDFAGTGLFLPNEGETNRVVPVGTMEQDRVQRMTSLLRRQIQAGDPGDPLSLSLQNLRRAQRAYHLDADYEASIIWTYAWTETLLDGLLLMSAWEKAIPHPKVAKWFKHGLVGRVKRVYSSRFGGQWDITLSDTPLGIWNSSVVDVRNRAVHLGYRPSEFEARDALKAGEGLQKVVLDRLARRRKELPRTTLLLLGVEGLKQRHMFDRALREVHEQGKVEEPWLGPVHIGA